MHSFDIKSTNVPAFLIKLWKLVEDSETNDLITWSNEGSSFIIRDQARFAKELLPQYFKHNNMASFIRQLNMYGFRKVMNYAKSGLRCENEEILFQHAFFCRDQVGLLELIKRKIPNTKSAEPSIRSNPKDVLTDLSSIREKQANMDTLLAKLKQENELLWRELTSMRQKHKAQEQIIQKVIQFLVSIVQRSNQNIGVQRNIPRMLKDIPGNKKSSEVTHTFDVVRKNKDCFIASLPPNKVVSPVGPVIHEVTDFDHEEVLSSLSPASNPTNEAEDPDYPLNSSPIDTTSIIEPLSILEPLQSTRSLPLNIDETSNDERVLGIPFDFTISVDHDTTKDEAKEKTNKAIIHTISIPENPSPDGSVEVLSLPETFVLTPENVLVYSPSISESSKKDENASDALLTPQIPTIHIGENDIALREHAFKLEDALNNQMIDNSKQNDHLNSSNVVDNKQPDNQLALTDTSLIRSNSITKNTLSNHVLNVEEELNWLQDQISSNSWNIDASKLLGVCPSWDNWTSLFPQLFSTDDIANNESAVSQIMNENSLKMNQNEIIGNELVQFTPSLLGVDLDTPPLDPPLLECLNQDATVPNFENESFHLSDEKIGSFTDKTSESDEQIAAAAAVDFLLGSENDLNTSNDDTSSKRHKTSKSPQKNFYNFSLWVIKTYGLATQENLDLVPDIAEFVQIIMGLFESMV